MSYVWPGLGGRCETRKKQPSLVPLVIYLTLNYENILWDLHIKNYENKTCMRGVKGGRHLILLQEGLLLSACLDLEIFHKSSGLIV